MISNCGSDERGKYSRGQAGDQTGKEYCIRTWYNRQWTCILRYYNKDPKIQKKVRKTLAKNARNAAKNNYVGYDQDQRLTYHDRLKKADWEPKNIKVKCEADCSSSTAANVIATGHQLNITALTKISPSCYTGNIRSALVSAGFKALTGSKYLISDRYLLPGDILLCEHHHVAINLDKGSAVKSSTTTKITISKKTKSNPYKQPTTSLKKGSKGEGVKWIQWMLSKKFKYSLGIDGIFGPNTDRAVRAFQKSKKLKQDGIVGPNTRKKLLA